MAGAVDAAFIAELFERYAAVLELYAAQRTRAASDCVQEAFIELARQVQAPEEPAAWLFRVVRNRSLNAHRAQNRRARHEEAAARVRQEQSRDDPVAATALEDLLHLLSETQREIVVLRVWGELSWQEIAEIAAVSRSSAHRIYVGSLTRLRHHLESIACPNTTQSQDE